MLQQTISEKINNISLLEKEDLSLFAELKNKYPFAEIIQLVYLQLIKRFDPISFEEELTKVAYKIRDRHKLVELLEESIKSTEVEVYEEHVVKTELNIPEKKEDDDVQIKENLILEDSVAVNEEKNTLEKSDDLDLNVQIAAEAFSSIFSKDFEPTIQYKLEDESVAENQLSQEKKNDKIELSDSTPKTTQRSFTNWLKSGKKEEKLTNNQIIDSIIATNPTISRPKKEFYDPSKQAIKSVDDEKIIYTETLAKILEMQGNFSKAISAYQQLSLTNPEKKTYFAKKIKDLNDKLNSK